MKKGNYTRAFYIILVPVILVVVLMNSGFLQARLPAMNIDGTKYNVAQFNYYYFTIYNQFVEDNFDENDEGPFDQSVALRTQYREDGVSWKEYFMQQAEDWLLEVTFYDTLAQNSGYTFSDEQLAPVQEQLDFIEEDRTANNITLKNYLVAYWGRGMSEAVYTKELTRAVEAQAYKAYLTESYTPEDSEIQSWLADNPQEDWQAVELRVITLDALPERGTGEIGADQISALTARLEDLVGRYEEGVDFDTLQADYSTCRLGDETGCATVVFADDLPQAAADWCLEAQETLEAGDTFYTVDESTGTAWFLRFEGFAGSAAQRIAADALSEEAIEAQTQSSVAQLTYSWNSFGRRLSAS